MKPKKTSRVVTVGAQQTNVLQRVLDGATQGASGPQSRARSVGLVVLVFHLDGTPGLLCSGVPRMSQDALSAVLQAVAAQMVVHPAPPAGEQH